MQIGNKIKSRRIEKGLTLEQVGNVLGVNKSTVRKWETGMIQNMKRDKIEKLANLLDMSPLEFIMEEPPKQQNETKAALIDIVNNMSDEQAAALLALLKK